MKLIRCTIENFGRLKDFEYEFSEGVNIVCQENGWGKSTFAAFLCAMLYGFPGARKKTAEENLREKYRPWQGGVYGGTLFFEAGGTEYELRRIFGRREAEDVFELRDARTNLPSFDFSKKTGEELFRLDRESFMRTVFTAQQDCATAATDDVNALIGGLTELAGDMGCYEEAMKRLVSAANRLSPKRQTGRLSRRADSIARMERAAAAGSALPEQIRLCEERKAEAVRGEALLQQELLELEKKRAFALREKERLRQNAEREQAAAGKKELLERLRSARERRCTQWEQAAAFFPGRVPLRAEIDGWLKKCREMERLEDRMQAAMLSEEEQQLLTKLERIADRAQTAMPGEGTAELKSRQERPADRAQTAMPGEGTADLKPRQERPADRAQTAMSGEGTADLKSRPVNPAGGWRLFAAGAGFFLPGLAAWLLAANGGGLSIAVRAAGAVFAAAGAVLTGRACVLLLKSGSGTGNKNSPPAPFADREREPADSWPRGTFSAEQEKYIRLREKERKLEEMHAQWAEIRRPLMTFLRELGFSPEEETEDLREQLEMLRDAADDCEDAKRLLREAEEELRRYEEELNRYEEELSRGELPGQESSAESFLQKHPQREPDPQILPGRKGSASGTDAGNREPEDPENYARQAEAVRRRLAQIREEIPRCDRMLEELLAEEEETETAMQELAALRTAQEEDQRNYSRIVAAAALLQKARESMTARYAEPIREGFGRYWEMAAGRSSAGICVDANCVVTVEEAGRQRETGQLSTGWRDLSGICLRIALADAMYLHRHSERPPLIMDDPFTNLDDKKIKGALRMLREVGEQYQILYFTCSSTRC